MLGLDIGYFEAAGQDIGFWFQGTRIHEGFFWGFLGLNFSTDKIFCKTNSYDSNILFKSWSSVCFNLLEPNIL